MCIGPARSPRRSPAGRVLHRGADSREDRVEDRAFAVLNRPCRLTLTLHPADPLADMLRENVGHPHPAKLRKDMRAQIIGILLPRGRLQHMVGQPPLLDVLAERLAPTGRVADLSRPGFIGGYDALASGITVA